MEGLPAQDAWLRLSTLEFAPHRIHALLDAYGGDPEALFVASDWSERMPDLNAKRLAHLSEIRARDLTKDREALAKSGARLVTVADSHYPANLRELPDRPPVLAVRGDLLPEDKFSLAIVGSRRATSYGLTLAYQFARDLAAHGLAIVSGGARGIDTQAHRGVVEGGGRTLAFLGCGVDVSYPSENQRLFDEISAGRGAVLSEFPMGTRPEPWRFPARNRLISGTSLGVLVIESPADSGSLITARQGGDQGRDVFAIPGQIGFGRSAGCHKLIQDGAKLVECVDDILSELGILALRSPGGTAPPGPILSLPPEQRRVLDLLTLQPRQMEGMITESGLMAAQVTGILTLLEMRGLAKRVPGGAFVRVL